MDKLVSYDKAITAHSFIEKLTKRLAEGNLRFSGDSTYLDSQIKFLDNPKGHLIIIIISFFALIHAVVGGEAAHLVGNEFI